MNVCLCLCVCVCVCVCVSVCVCVCLCVWSLQPKRMDRFWCYFPQMICRIFASDFFSRILKIQNGWRHGGHFVCFSFRHSHGRNFAPIFFKIEHKVQSCLPMFAIENQQNRSVTSGNIENRVFKKIKMAAKNYFFSNRASKVSISTNTDPLITNLIIFCRFD